MNEIDKDFYCSASAFVDFNTCNLLNRNIIPCEKGNCRFYHRKFPTPEQFKQEYNKEYPDEGKVIIYKNGIQVMSYGDAKEYLRKTTPIIVCTEYFGKLIVDTKEIT